MIRIAFFPRWRKFRELKRKHVDRWVDPTGVLLEMTKGDCYYCGCPGYTCVSKKNCCRYESL